jgi:DNA polymerase I-like protein with 3'-5' exonuclease and polymerase domains
MIEFFPEAQKRYYYDVYLPLTNYFLDMEITGIPIDLEVLKDITNKYNQKYNEVLNELNNFLLNNFGIIDFNPNSSLQKKDFLFNVLKLEPAYYTKAGKSPKYKNNILLAQTLKA